MVCLCTNLPHYTRFGLMRLAVVKGKRIYFASIVEMRTFVDPAACILPNGKDKRLGPIKSKSDLPKYQLTMRNYFNIPNQMAFSNVNQDS
jgi:hypothetical protein